MTSHSSNACRPTAGLAARRSWPSSLVPRLAAFLTRRLPLVALRDPKRVAAVFLLGLVTLAVAAVLTVRCTGADGDYHIGVVLPLSGEFEEASTELLRGIRMLVEEVNAEGGVDGRTIHLVLEDDANSPEGAAEAAERLADDERILGVVGHFYSSTAMGATGVYDARGLVNVVPVANDPRVTRGSDWVFGMLPPTDVEGRFMATYLADVLDVARVAVVHETDAYGAGLAGAFADEAAMNGIDVVEVTSFDTAEWFPGTPAREPDIDAMLVFSQVGVGREILSRLRDGGVSVPIFLPSVFVEDPSLPDFHRRLGGGPLFVVTPFLYQTANSQATRFQRRYVERYGEEPGAQAPMAYDAARLLVTAIRDAGRDRSGIRDHLAGIRDERAIHSVSGVLTMDDEGAVDRALYVTQVEDGHFKVAFTQLLPSGEGDLQSVDVAYVGIDHFRVGTIDPGRFAFQAELFMWVKWRDSRLDTSDIIIINGVHGVDDEQYVLVEDLSGPVRYRAYRIKSTFLTPFDLRRFPFDMQSLVLQVGHRTWDSTELLLVPDVGHFWTDPVTLHDPEWRYRGQSVYSEVYRYPSHFGNPLVQSRIDTPYFSSVNVELSVARTAVSHLITTLLPLVIILLLTVAIIWLTGVDFSARLRIGMTSLLAILVFHMTQSVYVPNVGYLTSIDVYFLMAYVCFFLLFFIMIGVYLLRESGRERLAILLNRGGPALVLLAVLSGFAWVAWRW